MFAPLVQVHTHVASLSPKPSYDCLLHGSSSGQPAPSGSGGSQEGDSSWGLVATVMTLSSSTPGLSCPSGGDSHSKSWCLQPASSAHPLLHPLLCQHHVPVLKPDHPHRECHSPTMGAIPGGSRAWAIHGDV